MELKAFLLCFAMFVVATTAATLCKCGTDDKESSNKAVAKYTIKMRDDDGNDYDERVEINSEEETEAFHVQNMSRDDGEDEADVVLDFKKNLTMLRMPEAKSCYLSKSTDGAPKPADLKKLLETDDGSGLVANGKTELKFRVAGPFLERSVLNDQMAALCAKLPINLIVKREDKSPREGLVHRSRFRRGRCTLHCYTKTKRYCIVFLCYTVEEDHCFRHC